MSPDELEALIREKITDEVLKRIALKIGEEAIHIVTREFQHAFGPKIPGGHMATFARLLQTTAMSCGLDAVNGMARASGAEKLLSDLITHNRLVML